MPGPMMMMMMRRQRRVHDWLWHLFNDPMRDNPWSIILLILLMGGWFAFAFRPLVSSWVKGRRHDG